MSIARALLNAYSWMNPALIPARPGYRFSARLIDGRQVDCQVIQGERPGRPGVSSQEAPGVTLGDIKVWREM